ncbi:MAG: FAD:protein FMN transferase [Gammaproteobacteria bacterium]|nr:MAG: FAD:protein FMN transferase [Gammaproteobacteria bacterium]
MLKHIFTSLLFILFLTSCSKPEPQLFNDSFFTFGTNITISIYTDDEKLAQTGFKTIRDEFRTLNNQLHPWNPSELHSLNAAISKSQPHQLSPLLHLMITEGQRFHKLSSGLFDPAVGSLVKLWKFDQAANIHTSIPKDSDIKQILSKRPSISEITIDQNMAVSSNDLVRLDFGGFAKGYATDKAIEMLQNLGINNAIVNAGGDLSAIGSKNNFPWKIGIRNPFYNGAIAAISTNERTNIFTSGNYERYFEKDGTRFHHIIDPNTGYPSVEIASATVIHDSGILADAAATALMVAGLNNWKQTAKSMDITKIMLISSDKRIYITPQMDKLVTILDTGLTKVVEDIHQ